mgnify:CR=1 FL=1
MSEIEKMKILKNKKSEILVCKKLRTKKINIERKIKKLTKNEKKNEKKAKKK